MREIREESGHAHRSLAASEGRVTEGGREGGRERSLSIEMVDRV
jgi:hypothetical protein